MKKLVILICAALLLNSCKKDFLGIKPDKAMVVPSSLTDLEALLDNTDYFNRFQPSLNEVQADDYYIDVDSWTTLSSIPEFKNGYIWSKEVYEGENTTNDWQVGYQAVFQANNVLEGLGKLDEKIENERYNQIMGRALFFRGLSFFQLAQIYCAPYIKGADNLELGIPLRLTADVNEKSERASVNATYLQILSDLQKAESLLSPFEVYKTRPSKAACQALLSRVYLAMQDFDQALTFSDLAIQNANYKLIDFTSLDSSLSYPMERFNDEVFFHSTMTTAGPIGRTRLNIDSVLFDSYKESDHRKSLWFTNYRDKIVFKGSYDGSTQYFNGLSLSECYLTKAECLIRQGRNEEGLQVLDFLLSTRINGHEPIVADSNVEDLNLVLIERRKELLFRGIRWTDLRRLNLDERTETTLVRNLGGTIYTLSPNSKNYVFPIQPDVIELTGIPQNERE